MGVAIARKSAGGAELVLVDQRAAELDAVSELIGGSQIAADSPEPTGGSRAVDRRQAKEEWAMNSSAEEFRTYVGGQQKVPAGDENARAVEPGR
jgi:hypothetical protein